MLSRLSASVVFTVLMAAVTASFANVAPGLSREQSLLRGQYTRALELSQRLYKSATSQYSEEIAANSEAGIIQEFYNAHKAMLQLEGEVKAIPSQQGKSKIWSTRQRVNSYEPRLMVDNYLSGPENDVIIFNQEYAASVTDLSLSSRGGIGFSMKRSYYSGGVYDGPMGRGWDFSYNAHITLSSSLSKAVMQINGVAYSFDKKDGEWRSASGNFYLLKENDGRLEVYDANLSRMEFEKSLEVENGYRLSALASRYSGYSVNRLSITYQPESDRIDYILDPYGNKILFAYDRFGRVIQISTSSNSIDYTYDHDGNLVAVSSAPIATSFTSASPLRVQYKYRKYSERSLLEEVVNNESSVRYCIEYDHDGRVSRIGKRSLDLEAMWSFNREGNVVKVQPAKPSPAVEYVFGASPCADLPSSIVVPALKAKTTLKFNLHGLLERRIDPLGVAKEYAYDLENPIPYLRINLLSVITRPIPDPQKAGKARIIDSYSYAPGSAFISTRQIVEYDAAGEERILSQQRFEYTSDWDVSVENSDGIITRHFYNKYGNLVISLDANNRASINYYSTKWPQREQIFTFSDGEIQGSGLCVRTIEDATRAQLDEACRVLGMPLFIFNDLLRVQPVAQVSSFAYDSMGSVAAIRKNGKVAYTLKNRSGEVLAAYETGKGKKVTVYNNNLLLEKVLHQFVPDGDASFQGSGTALFSGRFFAESIQYDSLERISSRCSTDEIFQGRKALFSYVRYPNGALQKIVDPMGLTRNDEYSADGLLSKQTLGLKAPVTVSAVHGYFADGTVAKSSDALGDITENRLDEYGRITIQILADGTQKHLSYDGLGRTLTESILADGKEIARQEFEYGANGKISAIYEYQISATSRTKNLKAQFAYDQAGNTVAQRDIQNNSWSYMLFDGLNRRVAVKKPSGDISISVYDLDSLRLAYEMNPIGRNRYRSSGTLHLRDQLGFPTVLIPIDAEQKCVMSRRSIHKYNSIGQEYLTKQFEQLERRRCYNSMGLVYKELTTPLSNTFGEAPIITLYSFNASGQLIQKTVNNNALAILGPKEDASAKLVSAPQTTTYTYDDLSRQHTIQQPDGLIVERIYNEHSLPVKMIWKHASRPEEVIRLLQLEYSNFARLTSISDGLSNKVIREYVYDPLGNCVLSRDTSASEAVETRHTFDSLGNLLSENIKIGELTLPGICVDYELALGTQRISFENLPPKSLANWSRQTIRRDTLGRTISVSLDDAKSPFASWDYLGALPSCRRIPESLITVRHAYSPRNDLIGTDFLEKSTKLGALEYLYDDEGNNLHSSTSLFQGGLDSYSFSQYLGYNAFRQLVEENNESHIPDEREVLQRRTQLFTGTNSIQAARTIRRVYDQADNMWAQYQGKRLAELQPNAFNQDNLSQFLSPATLINGSSLLSQQTLWELASNRDATQACFAPDGKLNADSNLYDKLGNLYEFSGEFWNGRRSIPVRWKLKYDVLGRLESMNGYAEKDLSLHKKGDRVAELSFLYDSSNRRVKKSVRDFSRSEVVITRHEFTTYIGNNQALVLKEDSGKFELREQYLWNPGTRELLMAALPESTAENIDRFATRRYFFQQDRGLNTICVTKNDNGRVQLVSGASYLGFGKNATTAKIQGIASSMVEDSTGRFAAYNGKLDDNLLSHWENSAERPQYLEVRLSKACDLSSLKIWTNGSFPKSFIAFVLPVGAESPGSFQSLASWCKDSINRDYGVYQQVEPIQATSDRPIIVPLHHTPGDRVVLVWESHRDRDIFIREIEVTQMPDNPGAIAYAGQWLDRETNLYYQINRYKLAGSSKFISPDPIGFMDGNNLYAYAKNNPLEWHDPNGEFAHVVLGAVSGAVINSGIYALQCWRNDEQEFSWKELGIQAAIGTVSGGVGAATFGAVCPWLASGVPKLASHGVNAVANIVISSTATGSTSGFSAGFADTMLHGGSVKEALISGLKSGFWGAAGGLITGGVLSVGGASLGSTLISGFVSGSTTGAARSALDTYRETRDWGETGWAAFNGAWKGGLFGTAVTGAAWGVGRATGRIVKLKGYPEELPDPREGNSNMLIRTKPGKRTFDGVKPEGGYARHHVKPLALGGRDVKGNIKQIPIELHITNPARGGGAQNAHPGSYVNSKPYGTIFY